MAFIQGRKEREMQRIVTPTKFSAMRWIFTYIRHIRDIRHIFREPKNKIQEK